MERGGGRSGYRERRRREGFWRVPFVDLLWNFKRGGARPLRPPLNPLVVTRVADCKINPCLELQLQFPIACSRLVKLFPKELQGSSSDNKKSIITKTD